MNSLNIWPFYRIDPRMLCMGQYWGLQEPLEKRPQNPIQLKQFVNKNYGRLLVQLD